MKVDDVLVFFLFGLTVLCVEQEHTESRTSPFVPIDARTMPFIILLSCHRVQLMVRPVSVIRKRKLFLERTDDVSDAILLL